jgi:hypothetical protein
MTKKSVAIPAITMVLAFMPVLGQAEQNKKPQRIDINSVARKLTGDEAKTALSRLSANASVNTVAFPGYVTVEKGLDGIRRAYVWTDGFPAGTQLSAQVFFPDGNVFNAGPWVFDSAFTPDGWTSGFEVLEVSGQNLQIVAWAVVNNVATSLLINSDTNVNVGIPLLRAAYETVPAENPTRLFLKVEGGLNVSAPFAMFYGGFRVIPYFLRGMMESTNESLVTFDVTGTGIPIGAPGDYDLVVCQSGMCDTVPVKHVQFYSSSSGKG